MSATTRREVYEVIDGEREYQEQKWEGHEHTPTEWLVYMQDYITEALHFVSRNPDPTANEFALHNIRKVTALGVACMEQRGVRYRE